MGKDKKKKHKKKALKEMTYMAPSLGSAAHWQIQRELDSMAHPSVTLEFEYFGTRYRGTAYPVGELR